MLEPSPTAQKTQLISGLIGALLIFVLFAVAPGFIGNSRNLLEEIQHRGYLKVLTLNSAASYYQGIDGPSGFEYQLSKWYAEYIGVEAQFITVNSFNDLYPELLFGGGDIIAAGLSEQDSDFSKSVLYGPRYYEVSNQVIYRKGKNKLPKKLKDIFGKPLKVISGTAQVKLLQELQRDNKELSWIEADDIATEELIEQLYAGEVDYILTDSHEMALQRRFFPEIRIAFELGEPRQLRWAFNNTGDISLDKSITDYFASIEKDGRLEQLIHRHYGHVAKFNYSDIKTFSRSIKRDLPRYKKLFKKEAKTNKLDWRLLASIGYQESLWNPRARSPTGVRGLMMLTMATSKQMGVTNRIDAKQSIRGGAKYFARVLKRVPAQVTEPDRTWLALASYNVGLGHVEDARKITQKNGGDPNKWIDVKRSLPLLSRKKWYKNTKYGYARGSEPVKYVENIRGYYDYMLGLELRALREAGKSVLLRNSDPLAPSL